MDRIIQRTPLNSEEREQFLFLTATTKLSIKKIADLLKTNQERHYKTLVVSQEYRELYVRAKADQQDLVVDGMEELADECIEKVLDIDVDPKTKNALVQAYRLKIDTERWTASKLKAGKYGDKLDVNHGGSVTANLIRYPTKQKVSGDILGLNVALNEPENKGGDRVVKKNTIVDKKVNTGGKSIKKVREQRTPKQKGLDKVKSK